MYEHNRPLSANPTETKSARQVPMNFYARTSKHKKPNLRNLPGTCARHDGTPAGIGAADKMKCNFVENDVIFDVLIIFDRKSKNNFKKQ